jgi:hypothetical protein
MTYSSLCFSRNSSNLKTEVLVIGGGTGGCAAALALAEAGRNVVMTCPNGWIGGQLTSQMVPPDEHWGIERYGCTRSYRKFRNRVRGYYLRNYPLLPSFRDDPYFNPGGGSVSKLCFEPRIGMAVLWEMLMRHISSGVLRVLTHHDVIGADVECGVIRSASFLDKRLNHSLTIDADFFLDATELGDLLPLVGEDYASGAESRSETGEPHALDGPGNPEDVQGFTWCFPMSIDDSESPDTDRYRGNAPAGYQHWKNYVPKLAPEWTGPLFSLIQPHPVTLAPYERVLLPPSNNGLIPLWKYRQIISKDRFCPSHKALDTTCVNWPQNDYFEGNVIDKEPDVVERFLEESRQLSLSLFHWLQNEAPRPDGGQGYGNLLLRPDLTGRADGLAQEPYYRESRRLRGLLTVTENHVGKEARGGQKAEFFEDSVGTGYYRIDLHPSTAGRNYIDIDSLPFQIPLRALVPQKTTNLLAAGKNLSVTHIANGCFRLHPVEWNVGESAGALADFCLRNGQIPAEVSANKNSVEEFQSELMARGVDLEWPGTT